MQVLPFSGVHYAGESNNSPNQDSEKAFVFDGESNSIENEPVEEKNTKIDNLLLNVVVSDDEHLNDGDWKLDASPNTRDSGVDSLDADMIGRELTSGNQECESSRSEPEWLEQDAPMAVWVKWRGKWQAGIRCGRSDWPLSTVRAKPTHDRKQYLVIFFPRKRNYSWADVLLLRPINEFPEPIAYRSHNIGVKLVKDLTLARRFVMQKLAVSMINTIEQLNSEALIETARSLATWRDFAFEASRCKDYSDLGKMLIKLENMILKRFLDSYWLERSLETWMERCQNVHSAESIEMLKEELGDAINWNEVHTLSNAPELVSEWKILKPEIMKCFSMSSPFNNGDTEPQSNDGFPNTGLQVSRKRPKLEIRRAEVHPPRPGTGPGSGSAQCLTFETDSTFFDRPVVNKNKQCTAFIEAKGRQCVRWANDGDVYCCVHLGSRFSSNLGKSEVVVAPPPGDTQMCDGTTVLGTKCKHRALPGSAFCKKHRANKDTEIISGSNSPPENKLKRKLEDEFMDEPESNTCKEIILSETHFNTEPTHCVGDGSRCDEAPKRHTLYCEKHLPNWLKRARNGKSRIVSKEVFIDLLRGCENHEQKLHLHRACELFYKFFKSVLSLRSPVPKEIQLQWVMSEASKDLKTGHFLTKLVCSEKERLTRVWGFNVNNIEQPVNILPVNNNNNTDDNIIKCNICSVKFSNDKALAEHWIDEHKNEARALFKCYVCAICLDSFTNNVQLAGHVQARHHVEFVEQCMLYQCIPCGSRFGIPDQLWSHVVAYHAANFKLVHPPSDTTTTTTTIAATTTDNNNDQVSNVNFDNQNGLQKFVCRFCGSKFDLLPDLGRHHQAVHMGSNPTGHRGPKRGVSFYENKLKPGRINRPKFKTLPFKMRNRAAGSMRKHIEPSPVSGDREPQWPETGGLGSLPVAQCSDVAKILYPEVNRTKPHPGNLELLSLARSVCCKISFQESLEKKYGVLPERLYLKAAKLCSEHNIFVEWHQDGFACPKGCKPGPGSELLARLTSLDGSVRPVAQTCAHTNPARPEWDMDECHYIINFDHPKQESVDRAIVLCDDISFGKETVPITCVVDEHLLGSLHDDDGQSNACFLPWESFTYVMKPLIDRSLDLGLLSLQLGCGCAHSTCSPKACDHVYLFDNDYDDAKDINGKSMKGRFPYDDKGRIILEEGYLVYECNNNCSCNKSCQNRVLQNGVRVKLEVFKSEDKGWAVRAGEPIERGTFVCEYIGEVINQHEANKRRHRYGKEGCSYIYEIDARVNDMIRLIEGEASYAIDATKYGNVSRYINHSCAPNLENHQVLVESLDSQLSHIGLYASRDIAMGEELSHNYMYMAPPGQGCKCKCGAVNCRGLVI